MQRSQEAQAHGEVGDVTGAAAMVAISAHATLGGDELVEDLEFALSPTVELQLRAGDVDEADRILEYLVPLLGGSARALALAEHARLRGTITLPATVMPRQICTTRSSAMTRTARPT